MNSRIVTRAFIVLLLATLVSSFTTYTPAMKYSPEGSWEYSVPGVQSGYESGIMLIAKEGKDYEITMVLNEYSKVEAENVVYKNKALSFSLWVESEQIKVSGTFDGDKFTAKISYSEGDFDLMAVRKAEE
jgi:hypothetical protein